MRCNIIRERITFLKYWFFIFGVLNILTGFAYAEYSIPSGRAVTWQGNVGVEGGIPTNYTKYGPTIETSAQGDDTSAIKTALNGAGSSQYVQLGSGTFSITGTITIPDGVILRGQGIASTILKQQSSTSGATISFGSGSYGSAVNLASGYVKGSTSITTSTPHGWSAGDVILIDQINGGTGFNPPTTNIGSNGTCGWCGRSSGTRSMGQLVQLASASGTSATLDIPLYINFNSGQTPQGVKLNKSAVMAGIEDLKIDNSTTMSSSQNNSGTINMSGAVNCWVKNVDIYGAKRMGIVLSMAYRNTIHGVIIHKTLLYTSDNGYALWLKDGASANLIENSIFHDMAAGPIFNGPTSGNVFSYNYITDMQSTTFPTAVRGGIVSHGAHPIMNLYEGNYLDGQYITGDFYWGSSSHNTIFRNRVVVDPVKTVQEFTVGIDYRSYYHNIVGNVLGDGRETGYITSTYPYGPNRIFIFEWGGSDNTLETTLIHQNYDYYHKAVIACNHADNPGCQGGTADTSLPVSLYLPVKPLWWGGLPWPPIGPDSSPMGGDIPAKLRYEGQPLPPEATGIQIPKGFDKVIP